jgi:hypothetical protein
VLSLKSLQRKFHLHFNLVKFYFAIMLDNSCKQLNPYIWLFATNLNSNIRTKKKLVCIFQVASFNIVSDWCYSPNFIYNDTIKLLNYCWIAQSFDIWNRHNNYISLNKTTSFFSPYHLYGHEKNMISCLFKFFFSKGIEIIIIIIIGFKQLPIFHF